MRRSTVAAAVLLLACAQHAVAARIPLSNGQLRSSGDGGYKLLNNLLSVAVNNVQISGEFLSNYFPVWFSNTDRVQAQPNCNRQAVLPEDAEDLPDAVRRIYDSGVLRIGVTSIVSMPYFNTTGTPNGFFYDLGNAVSNELGFLLGKTINAQFIVIPTTNFFENILTAINNGTVDTVIGVSYIKTRTLRVDYTCWYEGPSPFGLWRDTSKPLPANFTPTGSYQSWNTPVVRMATLRNTIFETALATYFPLATRVYFPSMDEAYASVGVTTDAVFSIIGETESWNEANNNKLSVQPGTHINYGGGNAFATRRV